jgi:hypothetical protein
MIMAEAITIDDLRQYRARQQEIRSIEDEIRYCYLPVASPSGNTSGGHSTQPGDPTARAIAKVEKLKIRRNKLQDQNDAVDLWMSRQRRSYISTICRYHYIIGMTWEKTCFRIYGTYSANTVRQAVYRYFNTTDI